jgi:hypothetical protein
MTKFEIKPVPPWFLITAPEQREEKQIIALCPTKAHAEMVKAALDMAEINSAHRALDSLDYLDN